MNAGSGMLIDIIIDTCGMSRIWLGWIVSFRTETVGIGKYVGIDMIHFDESIKNR